MREVVKPPHALANEHTLVAQRYAGYFVGHPYRNPQQTREVEIDRRRRWKEPAIVADDCLFCVRLTDAEAARRVLGYQYALDKESTWEQRAPFLAYGAMFGYMHLAALDNEPEFVVWINSGLEDVPEPGKFDSQRNLRRFCELFQDVTSEKRPEGWVTRPLPFITLPLRLKRKLCIEWNHLYLLWMEDNGLEYDFEKQEFWHEVELSRPGAADADDDYSDFDGFYE